MKTFFLNKSKANIYSYKASFVASLHLHIFYKTSDESNTMFSIHYGNIGVPHRSHNYNIIEWGSENDNILNSLIITFPCKVLALTFKIQLITLF